MNQMFIDFYFFHATRNSDRITNGCVEKQCGERNEIAKGPVGFRRRDES
jgi:hypothetical protein